MTFYFSLSSYSVYLQLCIFSYNNNIKYICSNIKCIGFEPIYYVINLNFVYKFDYMFLSIYFQFEIELIKLFFP